MKSITFVFLITMSLLVCFFSSQSRAAEELDLAAGWRFRLDPENRGEREAWFSPDYDTDSWQQIQAGRGWEEQGFGGYDGIAWYRRWINLPGEWTNGPVYLVLGGADDEYDLFVNGIKRAHFGSLKSKKSMHNRTSWIDLFPYLGGNKNVLLCLRVNDWGGGGGLVKRPVVLSSEFERYLSREEFFAREELDDTARKLQPILLPPDRYRIDWYPVTGLLDNPRRIGFVSDEMYCRETVPVLREYLDHANPRLRIWVAERLAELRCPDGFGILLEALLSENDSRRRGNDGYLFGRPGIADRVIALVGAPDTYDPAGSRELRDTVTAGWQKAWKETGDAFFKGLASPSPLIGKQTLRLEEFTVTRDMSDMEQFCFLAGRKLFAIGAMDGSFPPVGRLLGDQGGIWSLPVKLMDGYEIRIDEDGYDPWSLEDCRYFVNELSSCSFRFLRNGLSVSRKEFVLEDEPALLATVRIRNLTDVSRLLRINFTGYVNIRPGWKAGLPNALDRIEYVDDLVYASDQLLAEQGVLFGSKSKPVSRKLEDNRATLTYTLEIPPSGDGELTFIILAQRGIEKRTLRGQAGRLLRKAKLELKEKQDTYRSAPLSGITFRCSDQAVTRAFSAARVNLMMLTTDVRPFGPGPYFMAGIPDYAQLFGCDTFYSIAGAAAAGFGETAKAALETLAVSAQNKQGRVPHEIGITGHIISPGNIQETPQFISACHDYYNWTGDRDFLESMYPLSKQCIEYVLANGDQDQDLYPEGYGIMEVHGMSSENIDAACYLYEALKSLETMSNILRYGNEANRYAAMADDLRRRFNRDWWNSGEKMWADSLENGKQRMAGHWGVDIPMETGIADPDKARSALHRISREWVNKWTLFGPLPTGFSTCPFSNNILALGAFRYGETALGWKRLKLTARVVLEHGMLGAMENAVPRIDNTLQLWSAGPFLEAVVAGLAGVHPAAGEHRVEIFPKLPRELGFFSLENMVFGDHCLDFSWQRLNPGNSFIVKHTQGPVPLEVLFKGGLRNGTRFSVNGEEAQTATKMVSGMKAKTITVTIAPGKSVIIRQE